jgi:hypothetical protein
MRDRLTATTFAPLANTAAKLLATLSFHFFKKRFHAKVIGDCRGKRSPSL